MRVTQRTMLNNSLAGLNSNLSALTKVQNQLASGKVLNRPSDSPTDTNKSMQTRSDIAANDQQSRAITDATSRLSQTDSALDSMQDIIKRVQVLTTQGLNTGANDATSSAALATEVTALRDTMIGVANATVNGRPVFGGVTAGTSAYAADGSYIGIGTGPTDNPVTRRIGNNDEIRIDLTGPEVFGDDTTGKDLFTLVKGIADKLNAYPVDTVALSKDLAGLKTAQDQLSSAQATIGARQSRVEDAAGLNSERGLTLTAQLSAIEDVDIPKASLELSAQQVGYQASLAVAGKILQPTLMDFLR
jgi:flagellar hook-associated protein 3 FlgL